MKVSAPPVRESKSSAPVRWSIAAVLVLLAAIIPFLENRAIPIVFAGEIASPGVLNMLALMLVFGAFAITYDLLFGYTGLLSFGHALYFAIGAYGTAVIMSTFRFGLGGAVAIVLVAGIIAPIVIGLVCLRVKGIAFAMVTLAFAQAGAIFIGRDPFNVTGGDLGISVPFELLPEPLVGVANTRNLYWLTLALVVVVYLIARIATTSRAGRVWQAIRENEQRVEVLGLNPTRYKLVVFVLASFLATVCGVVYALVVGAAHTGVMHATFTMTLLVMVVLGGAGRLWGALIGGVLFTYLEHRLTEVSSTPAVGELPVVINVLLREPMFLLGTLFVLVVLFFPGGIASAIQGRGFRVPKLPKRRPGPETPGGEAASPDEPTEPGGRHGNASVSTPGSRGDGSDPAATGSEREAASTRGES